MRVPPNLALRDAVGRAAWMRADLTATAPTKARAGDEGVTGFFEGWTRPQLLALAATGALSTVVLGIGTLLLFF